MHYDYDKENKIQCPSLTLSEPAFFSVSHGPGEGAHISPPPFYFSPEASEELVLNMTIVGYLFEIHNFSVAQNLTILEMNMGFC